MDNSEEEEENLKDKESRSDTNKEVGVCVEELELSIQLEMDIRWFFFFLLLLYDQFQKKVHQLEEQLDYEMQAKDELEHKFKYDRTDEQDRQHEQRLCWFWQYRQTVFAATIDKYQ